MRTLKTYNEINEGLFFNKFSKLQKKVLDELGINLYFAATFGTAITALFPFFDTKVKTSQIKNTITDTDVVLIVICGLTIMMKESRENIEKLQNVVKERGLSSLVDNFMDAMKNLTKLFEKTGEILGRTISGVVDMFSYTALFVPFLVGLLDVIKLYQIGFDNFDEIMTNPKGATISTTMGLITISLKHITNMVIKRIKRNIKNKKTPSLSNEVVQKFENNIEQICENYFISSSQI